MKKYLKAIFAGLVAFFLVYLIGTICAETFILSEMSVKIRERIYTVGAITFIVVMAINYCSDEK